MFKPRSRTVPLLLLAAMVSTANITYAQEPIPDDSEEAVGEPDAGGDTSTGGSSATDAGNSGKGGTSAPRSTTAAVGGAAKNGGTRVVQGPDMNGCACRVAGPAQGHTDGTTALVLLSAALVTAARKRR